MFPIYSGVRLIQHADAPMFNRRFRCQEFGQMHPPMNTLPEPPENNALGAPSEQSLYGRLSHLAGRVGLGAIASFLLLATWTPPEEYEAASFWAMAFVFLVLCICGAIRILSGISRDIASMRGRSEPTTIRLRRKDL